GRLRELRRDVQQLRRPAGRRSHRPRRHPRARLPAAARGACGGNHPPAREGARRRAARLRDAGRGLVTYEGVPGVVDTREAHGETTLVVDPPRLGDAWRYLRDEQGFRFLADITPTDYLGWNERPTAGYIGTAVGRDLNAPGSAGLARKPRPTPKSIALKYNQLRLGRGAPRVRVQVWLDEDEPVESVVSV